jgi:hypothetical protein
LETALSSTRNYEHANRSLDAHARLGHEQPIRYLSALFLGCSHRELRELTDRFEGLLYRVVSPNGRYVYCFADTKGNEIGHFIRIPFEGGEVEEVTPDMPPYPTFGLGLSGQGNLLAFTIAVANEYQVYGVDISPSDALAPPQLICRSKNLIHLSCLSYDGRIAVVVLGSATKLLCGLRALDTRIPETIAELREEPI